MFCEKGTRSRAAPVVTSAVIYNPHEPCRRRRRTRRNRGRSLFALGNVDAFAPKLLKDCFSDPRVAGDGARTTAARLVNGGQNGCVEAQIYSMLCFADRPAHTNDKAHFGAKSKNSVGSVGRTKKGTALGSGL